MRHDFDVAVVGAGPTGLTIANLLGRFGIRAVLIERNPTTVQEPRAVSIDDESLRTLQAAGLIDAVIRDVALDYGSHYFTPGGARFVTVEPTTREYGYPRRNAFLQPVLEATLRDGLKRYPTIETWFETTCEEVNEDPEGVTLALRTAAGQARTIRVRYLAGTDGGRSFIRKVIGAKLVGSTYEQRWLIVDLAATDERFRQTRVLCNPARPTISLPGPHGTRRYEFMLQDGEGDDLATSPEFVRRLLRESGPDENAPTVRRQVYAFHARIADTWHTERIYLAGDAAHLTPPFAGQGMNSGLRDAHNLAWKLAAVCSGGLGHGLMASYGQERPAHAWSLIELAIKMGRVMMPSSPVQAFLVQSAFKAMRLVPSVQAWFAQMKYKPKPHYRAGFFVPEPDNALVGRMLPQPLLAMADGTTRLMDDVTGFGFALVVYGRTAEATAAKMADLDPGVGPLGRVAITPMRFNTGPGPHAVPAGRDLEDRLGAFARPDRDLVILLRPDRYVVAADAVAGMADITAFAEKVRRLAANTHAAEAHRATPLASAAE